MKTIRGFRLKLATLADLSGFMDDFRGDATRVLASKWTADVAREATFTADLAALGIKPKSKDYIKDACRKLNDDLASADFRHHTYNCRIDFMFLSGAVLAIFDHGDAAYQAAWKRKRAVEFWGWSEDMKRPENISEQNWEMREKVWRTLTKRSKFGRAITLSLLEPPLPGLSWKTVSGHIPSAEARIENCVSALLAEDKKSRADTSEEEISRLREYATRSLPKEVSKELMTGQLPAQPAKTSGREVKSPITAKKPSQAKDKEEPGEPAAKATHIDHADVILAHDGRTFIAVPSVGLAVDARIFVQVSSREISFKQSGVNYGTVAGVPPAARDHLKSCREAVLVEVEKDAEGRLLRAKFIAIVSDISFSEFHRQSLSSFNRPSKSLAARELEEWDKKQRQTS
ncbi:hypothetical protein [Rhizobium sp. MHM7A]|uniref:hypothetical protein n=1 Tax=Rhizobium sp. MHM7A TaxID=2583233 RepID=UPI0011065B1F|nr:hypothetical protein [Rhizobium sp. MHM7A]TLX16949.1 hypothetical protein FFR93_06305 [Rhizobium sp. MHM7A]